MNEKRSKTEFIPETSVYTSEIVPIVESKP